MSDKIINPDREIAIKNRKEFIDYMTNLRKNKYFWQHSNVELAKEDPPPTDYFAQLSGFHDKETNILWKFWQADKDGLKFLLEERYKHSMSYEDGEIYMEITKERKNAGK